MLTDHLELLKNQLTRIIPIESTLIFNQWFCENAIKFKEGNVWWPKDSVLKSYIKKYPKIKSTYSHCHSNAIFNWITYRYELFSGIAITFDPDTKTPTPLIHSFNVLHGFVYDFTFRMNADKFDPYFQKLPPLYYGLLIPKEFLMNQIAKYGWETNPTTGQPRINRSPLIDFFLENHVTL